MKILIAGAGVSAIHEAAVAGALRSLGHEVEVFSWAPYFASPVPVLQQYLQAQNKFLLGPRLARVQRDFVDRCTSYRPAMVFVYRGTHLGAAAIAAVRSALPACAVVGYCNDDPFSPAQPRWQWRHFRAAVPAYDVMLAYRPGNLADLREAGARQVGLLMPWFVPERVDEALSDWRPAALADVVFVGHYEDDHRLEYLTALDDAGVRVRICGPEWHRAPRRPWLRRHGAIRAVRDRDYFRTLRSARIALAFYSRRNRDSYTRRVFEIPATGTFMLAEYSPAMAAMFTEGRDAEFFRDPAELVAKARHYLANVAAREAVAAAGRARVHHDGHDIVSRFEALLPTLPLPAL